MESTKDLELALASLRALVEKSNNAVHTHPTMMRQQLLTLRREVNQTQGDSTIHPQGLVRKADPGTEVVVEDVKAILMSKEAVSAMRQLRGKDASSFIDLLDYAMTMIAPNTREYKTGFHSLQKMCVRNEILPSSFILPAEMIHTTSDQPEAAGSFADVWQGLYGERAIALKVVRICGKSDMQAMMKNFCKEAVVWKHLSHPNITPFLGIDTTHFRLSMISEWMPQGNIRTFILANPGANRIEMVLDIARGLRYLHSAGVIHGDLKGPNILINETGRACLSDFGLTTIIYDANTLNTPTVSTVSSGSIRWMAPEILDPDSAGISQATCALSQSDVHSFAMVMWEVFAGCVPYVEYRLDAAVINQILRGTRPKRLPETIQRGLSDEIWECMEICWQHDWKSRPSMAEVHAALKGIVRPSGRKRHLRDLRPQRYGTLGIGKVSPLTAVYDCKRSNPMTFMDDLDLDASSAFAEGADVNPLTSGFSDAELVYTPLECRDDEHSYEAVLFPPLRMPHHRLRSSGGGISRTV